MDHDPAAPSRKTALRRRQAPGLLRYGCLAFLLIVFCSCLVVNALVTTEMFVSSPAVALLSFVLATSTAVPYGLLLLWIDRNEQEPLYLVLVAFLWGAVIATALSLVANTLFGVTLFGLTQDAAFSEQATASLSAPFAEELTKGAAVFVLFALFRRDFDNVLDGILYGALVGLGFAWFENVVYYSRAGEGGVLEMLKLTYLRGLLNGVSSHVAYTGLTGLGFGLARVLRSGVLRFGIPVFFVGLAMAAHAAWNTFAGVAVQVFVAALGLDGEAAVYLGGLPFAVLLLQSPFVLLLALVAILVWRHENRLILRYLADEPSGIVTEQEARKLVPARARARTGIRRLLTHGPAVWWHHRRLNRDLIKLAFVRWHHDEDPEVHWPPDQDADVLQLRDRILRRKARRRSAV